MHEIQSHWNWDKGGICFIADKWHIRNEQGFIASCCVVGAITFLLECFRRSGIGFDQRIIRRRRGTGSKPCFWEEVCRAMIYLLQVAAAYLLMLWVSLSLLAFVALMLSVSVTNAVTTESP